MIPVPQDASRQDIDQWCSRTVVMVPHNGVYVPGFYMGCSESRTVNVEPLNNAAHGDRISVPHGAVRVTWPLCGSVNLTERGYAVHAARITQKQYRRSWHVTGLRIVTPRAWDVAKRFGLTPERFKPNEFDMAVACFNPVYPSMDEAEASIARGDVLSVAVNRNLIVVGDTDGKRMFYVDGVLAATASGGRLFPAGTERSYYRVLKATEGRYAA
jgi:hypothetical protein